MHNKCHLIWYLSHSFNIHYILFFFLLSTVFITVLFYPSKTFFNGPERNKENPNGGSKAGFPSRIRKFIFPHNSLGVISVHLAENT